MKKEDLRINNYYHSVKFNLPVKLQIEDFYDLCADCQGAELDRDIINQKYQPIPLIENNLLKVYASDISPNKTYCFAGDKISVSIRFLKDGKSNICIMTDDEEIYIRNYIKYIHTFQNLIFALTNKELTLK